jgi:hypothetical protein
MTALPHEVRARVPFVLAGGQLGGQMQRGSRLA